MKHKVLLFLAALIIIIDGSSCVLHYEHGAPYNTFRGGYRTHRHWGSQRYGNSTHRFWAKRHKGPRLYKDRGHFRF